VVNISVFRKRSTSAFFLLLVIAGCSSLGQIQTQADKPIAPQELPAGSGWWYARFHLSWPADTEPVWYMDLCLAHQVFLPILETYKDDIKLWRFHRRAARDAAGRMFSFIFYARASTAGHIFSALKSDTLINQLKVDGIIEWTEYDDPTRITRPNIEDTSDQQWTASVQKTWPYYIMGASQMWLNLIAQVASENPEGFAAASSSRIEAYYRQIDQIILDLWQQEGRHAFMHHLNALFEYAPLIYWEKRYMKF
jgi:hypothetical protein